MPLTLRRTRPPLESLRPDRVCVIKPSALGDVVQTMSLLSGLRRLWPTSHISWVVKQSLADILRGQPDLDEILPLPSRFRSRPVAITREVLRALRAEPFDLAIDVQGLARSGLLCLASGATRRVGFANAREGAAFTYTDRVPVSTMDVPVIDRYWLLARALGATGNPPLPRLHCNPFVVANAREVLSGLPRPLLAVCPGTTWETKRWPPRYFAALARRAYAEFGAGLMIVGGDDTSGVAADLAANHPGPVVNLAGRTSLRELAAVSSVADVFLSGDTGPMHIAAAVGTRVVGVFTCTSPTRSGPGGSHDLVATRIGCAASYVRKCSSMACMDELRPARVWRSLRAALVSEAAHSRAA